jgi:photosystem II stability/assembly factor-like uncharacterized protein
MMSVRRVLLSTVVLMSAAAFPALAQDWQAIGPWGGYDFVLKAPDRTGQRVYASGNTGLFRSDDRGGRWTRLVGSADGRFGIGENRFDVSRADPDVVLAVSGDSRGVLYSSDGGTSWRLVLQFDTLSSTRVMAVAVSQVDIDRLEVFTAEYGQYVSSPRRFGSQDAGLNWTNQGIAVPASYGCPPEMIRVHAVTAAVFDVSVADKLYGSTVLQCNNASNIIRHDLWSDQGGMNAIMAADTVQSVFPLLVSEISQTRPHLYWRNQRGLSRVPVDGFGSTLLSVFASAISTTENLLLAGTTLDLLASSDGGVTWTGLGDATFFQGLERTDAFSSVRFEDGDTLASNRFGIFLKAEATPWQWRSSGLGGAPVAAMQVSPDGSRIWASTRGSRGTNHGAYPGSVFQRTSDAGATWHMPNGAQMPFELSKIIVDPATELVPGGAVLHASGRNCLAFCGAVVSEGYGLYNSTDDGETWTIIDGSGPAGFGNSPAIAGNFLAGSLGSRTLLALAGDGRQGVFRSIDSGQVWTSASLGLPLPIINPPETQLGLDLIASGAQPGTFYLGARIDWQPGTQDYPTLPAGVFRTVDHGETWQHLANGLPQVEPGNSATGVLRLAAHPTDPQRLWAVTYERDPRFQGWTNRVFRTIDGAATWSEASVGLPISEWWAIAVENQRPDYVYVGGDAGVFFSRDGGSSWQRLGNLPLASTYALSVNPTGVYAGGLFGIHRIAIPDQPNAIFRSGFEAD